MLYSCIPLLYLTRSLSIIWFLGLHIKGCIILTGTKLTCISFDACSVILSNSNKLNNMCREGVHIGCIICSLSLLVKFNNYFFCIFLALMELCSSTYLSRLCYVPVYCLSSLSLVIKQEKSVIRLRGYVNGTEYSKTNSTYFIHNVNTIADGNKNSPTWVFTVCSWTLSIEPLGPNMFAKCHPLIRHRR